MEKDFEAGVKSAAPLFKRAKGCSGMTLQRSHENPQRYRLFVQWETLENHTKDFRELRRFPGMAQAGRPLLRVAAECRARRPKWCTGSEFTRSFRAPAGNQSEILKH